ncbi:redoxin domain-containing protein [Leucobacter chromiiresistens]|uniref:Peroxiredoxin n=1 Tax=Leucobacter chromiiresistens TaxID=1079994 RepID=A0A147EPB3_9MICO|nr:redoxin domain-containing protein [Leucobacter chromiiresistens]KTR86202.1 peroxiredoxin [Leucobacter chromiiresistens]
MVLAAGAAAPDFALSDQYGSETVLSDLLRDGPVALAFVPFAFSRICTSEFAELSAHLDLFAGRSVQLVGITVDSVWTLRAWAEQEGFSFPILSDFWPHGEVARAYGALVERTGAAARATVVVGRDGRVAASFSSDAVEARPLAAYRKAVSALPLA